LLLVASKWVVSLGVCVCVCVCARQGCTAAAPTPCCVCVCVCCVCVCGPLTHSTGGLMSISTRVILLPSISSWGNCRLVASMTHISTSHPSIPSIKNVAWCHNKTPKKKGGGGGGGGCVTCDTCWLCRCTGSVVPPPRVNYRPDVSRRWGSRGGGRGGSLLRASLHCFCGPWHHEKQQQEI